MHGSNKILKCLEFYSGIGGMHFGIDMAFCQQKNVNGSKRFEGYEIVQSFDINTVANQVYKEHFGTSVNPATILSLTPQSIEKYNAYDLWTMSPPCQPYTRQGKQKDVEDARAASFLHLLDILPQLNLLPKYLLIENVVGFEVSESRTRLIGVLQSLNYAFQEFRLSPLQFGIPNSRTRYFLIASLHSNPPSFNQPKSDHDHPPILEAIPGKSNQTSSTLSLSSFFSPIDLCSDDLFENFQVPESTLYKSGWSSDIVFPESNRCCCFTKNYGRLTEGTGSLLQISSPDLVAIPNDLESLKKLKLRYFSPEEIAKLHGFPDSLSFATVTRKQAYGLLGNSLNVIVVSELLKYLIFEWIPNGNETNSSSSNQKE